MPFEAVNPGYRRLKRRGIVVVACTHEEEAALDLLLLRAVGSDFQRPRLLRAGVVCLVHMVVAQNLFVDAGLSSGLSHVLYYEVAFGNRGLLHPGFPWEAKGVEIRVTSNAWVLEEGPSPSQLSAAFEDHEAEVGVTLLQSVREIDTRDAC